MSREDNRVRSARRHAKTLGLRVVLHRSAAVELLKGDNPVHHGTLDTAEAYLHEHRASQPPRRSKPQPPGDWAPMIDDYLRSLVAAGQRQATLHLRRDHLNRIARGIGCPPAAVTAERLVDWFGQQAHWKLETRRGYRNAARGFFAWAYKTGRVVSISPTRCQACGRSCQRPDQPPTTFGAKPWRALMPAHG